MKIKNQKLKIKNVKSEIRNLKFEIQDTIQAALFSCIVLFSVGCNNALQTSGGSPADVSVNSLVPEAFRIIQQGLADNDPQVRANTIEVIMATRAVPLMPKVQRLMNDQPTPVRFLAILAVGDLKYALAENELMQLLNDKDQNVAIAAAYSLTKLSRLEYLKVIQNAVASGDQTVRANAAFLLGKSGDRSKLTGEALWWTLQRRDSSDKVRFNAAESLAMLGDQNIYPRLWAMLISAYADDRAVGIRAMGALGTEQAKNALITMLDDSVLEVRLTAAEQLGKLADPAGEPVVLDVFTKNLTAGLDKQSLEHVNILTALAIGQIGTNNLTKYLPQLLKDESNFVRIAAAKAVFQCAMRK
jgi:HEAT repeat protein